jgi:hypothetical protein
MPIEDKNLHSYLSWIDSELKIYEAYHDSKETKAWTAVVAYVPAIIVLGQKAGKALSCKPLGYAMRVVLTIVFLLACEQIRTFVNFQFDKRRTADRTTRGLRRAKGKLLADPSYLMTASTDVINEDWPTFIKKEIDGVPVEPDKYCGTESPSRAMLYIGTLVAMGALWVLRCLE